MAYFYVNICKSILISSNSAFVSPFTSQNIKKIAVCCTAVKTARVNTAYLPNCNNCL